jgi:hypothetical protein
MSSKILHDMQLMDSIYLNKRGNDHDTSVWAYYRLTSLGGNLGDHIELCPITWPALEDSETPVLLVCDTGYTSALPNTVEHLKTKWDINHESSTLIGLRVSEREVDELLL